MSRDPRVTALRHAARNGVPWVHMDGPLVVLVLHGEGNPITGEQRGTVVTRMCRSAGLAKAVAARVLDALALFPQRDPLATAELYAEAALRFARLRRRQAA